MFSSFIGLSDLFPIVSQRLGVRVWRQRKGSCARQLHRFESRNAFSGEMVSCRHSEHRDEFKSYEVALNRVLLTSWDQERVLVFSFFSLVCVVC